MLSVFGAPGLPGSSRHRRVPVSVPTSWGSGPLASTAGLVRNGASAWRALGPARAMAGRNPWARLARWGAVKLLEGIITSNTDRFDEPNQAPTGYRICCTSSLKCSTWPTYTGVYWYLGSASSCGTLSPIWCPPLNPCQNVGNATWPTTHASVIATRRKSRIGFADTGEPFAVYSRDSSVPLPAQNPSWIIPSVYVPAAVPDTVDDPMPAEVPFVDPDSAPVARPWPVPEPLPYPELPSRVRHPDRVYTREVGPEPLARRRLRPAPRVIEVPGTDGSLPNDLPSAKPDSKGRLDPWVPQWPAAPTRGVRERKFFGPAVTLPGGRAIRAVINGVTESLDVLDCLHKALPYKYRAKLTAEQKRKAAANPKQHTGKFSTKLTPQQKAEAVWKNWRHMNAGVEEPEKILRQKRNGGVVEISNPDFSEDLFECLAKNEAVDRIFGKMGKQVGRTGQDLPGAGTGKGRNRDTIGRGPASGPAL